MYEKFADYMYYLLTSPLKKVKRSVNQWYILFEVLGSRFDDAMDSLYKAQEQTMLAICHPAMLPVYAEDRPNLIRYLGEADENYRIRISMYREVCKLGGTNAGVKLAVKTLGFDVVDIIAAKDLCGDPKRWAEFYVQIHMLPDDRMPISYDILRKEVRRVKEVSAKDNYQIVFSLEDKGECFQEDFRNILSAYEKLYGDCKDRIIIRMEDEKDADLNVYVEIRHNLWYFNGEYDFDGTNTFDAYEKKEKL